MGMRVIGDGGVVVIISAVVDDPGIITASGDDNEKHSKCADNTPPTVISGNHLCLAEKLTSEFIPSYVWFFVKVCGVIFVIIWIRWTFPRIRVDKLMNFGWKFLLPLSILNIVVTGAGLYIYNNYF